MIVLVPVRYNLRVLREYLPFQTVSGRGASNPTVVAASPAAPPRCMRASLRCRSGDMIISLMEERWMSSVLGLSWRSGHRRRSSQLESYLLASISRGAVPIHASSIVSGSADCRPPKNAVGGRKPFRDWDRCSVVLPSSWPAS